MKNPKSLYVSSVRKVMKVRQIRNIVVLFLAILIALATLLIIYVSIMKKNIDEAFPSGSNESIVSESGSVVPETSGSSSIPTETTVSSTPPDETTVNTETTLPGETETESLLPVDSPPEVDVFINKSTLLQTVTHEQRDIAYGKLKQGVKQYIADAAGTRIGFYYINLKNNEEFGRNDLTPYVVGSSINLPINLILYDTVRNQSLSFREVMEYREDDKTDGAGTIKDKAYGSQFYIRELSRLSITGGDNVATAMLLRRLGGIEVVSEEFRMISGIIDFVKVHKYTDYSGTVLSGAYRSGVQDLARYAEALYYRYMIYPEDYQLLMNDLAQTESDWGVADQFPEGTQVFHKTGSNNTYHSETDVAIIICEEPIIICVSVEAGTPAEARKIQAALGKLVQEYISSCYT
jgi:beta-lactamase class A